MADCISTYMQYALDLDDRHYERKMQNCEKQINSLYDEIENIEVTIQDLERRKEGIKRQAVTVDNIYKYLMYFDRMYAKLTDDQKRPVLNQFCLRFVHGISDRG